MLGTLNSSKKRDVYILSTYKKRPQKKIKSGLLGDITEDEKTLLGSYSKEKEKYIQRFTSFIIMRSELLADEVRRGVAAKLWELVKEGKL